VIEAVLLGGAMVAGAPWVLVGLLLVGTLSPWVGGVAVLTLGLFGGGPAIRRSVDVQFCRSVADELRAGASLRNALAVAAHEIGDHALAGACRVGRPFGEVADLVAQRLPGVGPVAAGAIRIAGESGGTVADSFEAIALLASDEQELRDERKAATAQVRASALVISVLPVVLLTGLMASGRLDLIGSGGSLVFGLMVGGLLLIVVGLLSIWRTVRRAEVA
jgi:Flp pilus assembly protein TadB